MNIDFPITFDKMNGSGNDFIIIDNRSGAVPDEYQSEFSRLVCRRMFSLGADGVILIEDCAEADFRWQFYNADGSMAEMCGNGSRCAARFAWRHKIAGQSMTFATLAGIIEAEIRDEESLVKVRLTNPTDFRDNLSVELDGQEFPLHFVNSGVPHAVIFTDHDEVPVETWGRKVRHHKLFAPEGTNVNFVQITGEDSIKVRTYERGVEGETLACGTGNVAACLYSAMRKGLRSPISVETRGGERNLVYFTLQGGLMAAKDIFLEGPTRLICSGELTPEAILQQGM